MTHLRPKQEYIDRYDKITVQDCRWRENFHNNYQPSEELMAKAPSPDFHKAVGKISLHYDLLFATLDWYDRKESTINEWMENDRHRDELLETAKPPQDIRCLKCYSLITADDKILHDITGPVRVLFLYDCKNCDTRRCFFNDGEEYIRKPRTCEKCNSEVEQRSERVEDERIIITTTCGKCGHLATEEIDLRTKQEEPDPDYEKDRARFCLTAETVKKPRDEKWQLEGMAKMVDEWKEKEKHKEDYDAVKRIQKLTVIDLEKLIVPLVEVAGYVKLQFGTPDMGRDLIVPFSVNDAKSGRSDWDSSHTLQKLLKEALRATNWRLMTEGISYRLGILTGRLRAYEREEDLLALVRKQDKHEKEEAGDESDVSLR